MVARGGGEDKDARVWARAIVASGALLVLGGCGGCRSKEAARSPLERPLGRGLVLGALEEPDTLDPVFTRLAGAQEIVRVLFRDLTDYDERWSVMPALADGLPEIETTTTGAPRARWRLRPGLRWSDGHPLTASDVAFGLQIARDPDLEATSREVTREIAGIEVLSPTELIVSWRRPAPWLAAPRTHPILPRHAYPDPAVSPRPFAGLGQRPISSGPYRLAEWVPGQFLRVEPNPHWAGPPPHLPSITWRFFGTEDTFEAELATGGIDALGESSGLSVERAASLEPRLRETHVVEYTDSGLWLHLALRTDLAPLSDVRVRRALSRAIDRRIMARLVYGDRATPAHGPFPARHAAHRARVEPGADPVRAGQLLDEAGFPRASATSTRAGPAGPLTLELQFASGSRASEKAATFVKAELARVGVGVTLSALPLRVLFSKMRGSTHAPLVLVAWRFGPDFDASAMLRSGGAQNYGRLSDPELDRLLDAARSAPDLSRWADDLAAVEVRYRELLPSIPLLFRRSASVHPRALLGWRPTGSQTPVTWNAEAWAWAAPRPGGEPGP